MEIEKIMDIVLYVSMIQGFFVAFILINKKYSNLSALKHIVTLLILISFLILGRLNFQPEWIEKFATLFLLPDVILFLFGPLIWFFTLSILRQKLPTKFNYWIHYLPASIHIFILNTTIGGTLTGYFDFWSENWISYWYLIIEGTAIMSLLCYIFVSWKSLLVYNKEYLSQHSKSINTVFLLWFFRMSGALGIIWAYYFLINKLTYSSTFLPYYMVWIGLSFTIFYLSYMILSIPSILSLPEIVLIPIDLKEIEKNEKINDDLKNILTHHMKNEKPFLNGELKLEHLAQQLNLSIHETSKAINTNFQQNFFDFVNAHRIEEFISSRPLDKFKNLNTIELAYSVGFNSKSAFNRAFKKETGTNPRDYFSNSDSTFSEKELKF